MTDPCATCETQWAILHYDESVVPYPTEEKARAACTRFQSVRWSPLRHARLVRRNVILGSWGSADG